MVYLLVTASNWSGRPGYMTSLPSWSCGFDASARLASAEHSRSYAELGGPAGVWGRPAAGRPHAGWQGRFQAVTACLVSLLVTWMVRGLAASRTGMVRVSTPAA
jgi:hypothetical protein